jgi:hypothetical protein
MPTVKICSKCFNVHCKCKNKKKFECDELLIFAIKTLNEKGYKTDFCCSGHIIDKKLTPPHIQTYILFKKIYNFKKIPANFIIEHEEKPYRPRVSKRTYIGRITNLPTRDYESQTKLIFKNIQEINKWVRGLDVNK